MKINRIADVWLSFVVACREEFGDYMGKLLDLRLCRLMEAFLMEFVGVELAKVSRFSKNLENRFFNRWNHRKMSEIIKFSKKLCKKLSNLCQKSELLW